jgi:hypothetical protein
MKSLKFSWHDDFKHGDLLKLNVELNAEVFLSNCWNESTTGRNAMINVQSRVSYALASSNTIPGNVETINHYKITNVCPRERPAVN